MINHFKNTLSATRLHWIVMTLHELTEEERRAVDSIDMTPILGTPAERLRMAMDKAIEFMRRLKLAESSQKMAWSEQRQQAEIASNAFRVLREVRKDNGISQDSKDMIDKFLGPWA